MLPSVTGEQLRPSGVNAMRMKNKAWPTTETARNRVARAPLVRRLGVMVSDLDTMNIRGGPGSPQLPPR